jgi:NTP pyrophosphatase (non-canonical NTP hydrolase)
MLRVTGVKMSSSGQSIASLQKRIVAFRDARDWKQFHNPKDMALSLILEAAEVIEHFQWKNEQEIKNHLTKNKGAVGEELADVLYWVLLMSHDLGIDLGRIFEQKMSKNEAKYPIEKSKGSHKKYTELK